MKDVRKLVHEEFKHLLNQGELQEDILTMIDFTIQECERAWQKEKQNLGQQIIHYRNEVEKLKKEKEELERQVELVTQHKKFVRNFQKNLAKVMLEPEIIKLVKSIPLEAYKKDLIKKIEKLKEEINAKVEWITPEVAICLSLIDEFIEEIKGGEE